ncbi:putative secreted protein [Propionispora sp. 2/2-37]|uniref:hypothetical protein n=1 Tax=Propionispora sp. 2/2-37 TaxID=1677858 RepID=UPI0006BB72B1|nr:hypothetical protein [Propionispora sp. 2/2-37]CUH95254.1 putative secreted protein [Propionispora sp. 2/2-37]
MKKNAKIFVMALMIMGVTSGIAFANSTEPRTTAEQPFILDRTHNQITLDREYPELGLRSHSWITGTGSQTVAHTQLIDVASGKVVKELSRDCNYADLPYSHSYTDPIEYGSN